MLARPELAPWRPGVVSLGRAMARHWAALSLLLYTALAGMVCAAVWRTPTTAAIGHPLDTPHVLWFLRWYPFAIGHAHHLLTSDYIDYPGGVNLMWNNSIPLLGVLLSPVTIAAGPVIALNVLTTLAPALSAWTAFLALRRYVMRAAAAVVGGAVFGFSPYLMTQSLGHPQLAFAALVPLTLMILDEILVRQRRRAVSAGLALGALGAAQLLIGEELLITTGLIAGFGVALLVVLNRRQAVAHAPHATRALAVAAATFVLLAAYPLGVQLLGPQQAHGPLQPAAIYQTDLLGFVIPTSRQLLAPGPVVELSQRFRGPLENGSYLGLPLIGLIYWMARRQWSRPVVRWAVLLTLSICILSVGFALRTVGLMTGVPMPWSLIGWAPILDHILPVRLMGLAFLLAGLLVALYVDHGLASPSRSQRRFALGITGLTLLALLPRPLPVLPVTVPAFFTSEAIRQIEPGSVVLVAPLAQAYNSEAMGWQAQAGMRFRMPEAYAYGPNWLNPAPSRLQAAMVAIQLNGDRRSLPQPERPKLLGELRDWNVDTVIVGPMDHQPAMVDFLSQLLGRPPVSTGGVYVWWSVDQLAAG